MAANPLLSEFLQFFQDLPFGAIGAAASAGGKNIAVDLATAEAIAAAAVKDFFNPATPNVPTAPGATPATTAAITAAVGS